MKKLIIPVAALVLAFASSAFTAKKTSGAFYHYTSSSFAIADIQNRANYVRLDTDPCDDGSDICGVNLATDTGLGNAPNTSEFNAVKGDLWTSQQNGAPVTAGVEVMQPE